MATQVTVNRMLRLQAASSAQACSPSPEVRGCTIVMCGGKLIVLPRRNDGSPERPEPAVKVMDLEEDAAGG